ncbi:uncharacterized protein LOC112637399 [Camponotus floridanus]|uniref:uncharacterized protein LOC112637399 n=1 Tax=Camponotus floridanus TaxID=104421 RepID=UPI000DC6915D|nr:uncharacterized protein LOC112637399 [Camponotus floridanus]
MSNGNNKNACASHQVGNFYLEKNNYPLATCSNTGYDYFNDTQKQCSAVLVKSTDATHKDTQFSLDGSVIEEIGIINKKRNATIELSNEKRLRRNSSDNSSVEQDESDENCNVMDNANRICTSSDDMKTIRKSLQTLQENVCYIKASVDRLERKFNLQTDFRTAINEIGLPISNRQAYMAIDADKEKIAAIQGYMQSLGGINLRDTLNEFMKATFTDEFVAKNLTWRRGKAEKLHFRESAISVAFYGATKNIASLVDVTLKKYSEEIKIAIKNASQRHYMITIGRPPRVKDSIEKERAILARYER